MSSLTEHAKRRRGALILSAVLLLVGLLGQTLMVAYADLEAEQESVAGKAASAKEGEPETPPESDPGPDSDPSDDGPEDEPAPTTLPTGAPEADGGEVTSKAAGPPGQTKASAGTSKIKWGDEYIPQLGEPRNVPHVPSCAFTVELWGVTEALTATATFTGQAPTGKGTDLGGGDITVPTGNLSTGGGSTLNAYRVFDLADALREIEPHPNQGWHITVEVSWPSTHKPQTDKYKTIWVEGCPEPEPARGIELVKSGPSTATVGDTIAYDFTVTNTGEAPITDLRLDDTVLGQGILADQLQGITLAPEASRTVTFSGFEVAEAAINEGPDGIRNVATVTGTSAGEQVSATDDHRLEVLPAPTRGISIAKSGAARAEPGDRVDYTFVITNAGTTPITDLALDDTILGVGILADQLQGITLAAAGNPGSSTTVTYTDYEVVLADLTAPGIIKNVATVTGTAGGQTVTDDDDHELVVDIDRGIELVKSGPATAEPGDLIDYTFAITNTSNVPVSSLVLDDTILGEGILADQLAGVTLAPAGQSGASTTVTYTGYVVHIGDLNVGDDTIRNVATVTGRAAGSDVTASDDHNLRVDHRRGIAVAKSGAASAAPGELVSYTFTITNTGNLPVSGLRLDDDVLGDDILSGQLHGVTLAPAGVPGDSWTVVYTGYEVTLGAINHETDTIRNTVEVTGTSGGQPVSDTDDHDLVVEQTDFVVTKTPNQVVATVGSTITYTFTFANTGNVPLTLTNLRDRFYPSAAAAFAPYAAGGHLAGSETVLDSRVAGTVVQPGQDVSVDWDYTAREQDRAENGTYYNQVFFFATTAAAPAHVPGGLEAFQTDVPPPTGELEGRDRAQVPTAGIRVDKVATPRSIATPTAGTVITYRFTITNTGSVPLNLALEDVFWTGTNRSGERLRVNLTGQMPATPLAAGAAPISVTVPYTITQADINAGGIFNTAFVTGTPPTGPPVTDDDDETVVLGQNPAISLDKSGPATATVGQQIAYSFVITNSGNLPLTNIRLNDPRLSISAVQVAGGLQPGASTAPFTATYTVTAADGQAGQILNTATAVGTPPSGADVSAQDSHTVTVSPSPPPPPPAASIGLTKSHDTTGWPATHVAGDRVVYRFQVRNTGPVTLTNVHIVDQLLGYTGGTSVLSVTPSTLAPGAVGTATAAYTLTQADLDRGEVYNVATATGTDPAGSRVSATDDERVGLTPVLAGTPIIRLLKSHDADALGATQQAGDQITYLFEVRNPGAVTLTGVHIIDDMLGYSGNPLSLAVTPSTLPPGGIGYASATYAITDLDLQEGEVHNVATVIGIDPDGNRVQHTDDERVGLTPVLGEQIAPAISLVKSSSVGDGARVGDEITYSFEVTNVGDVPLTNVQVADPLLGQGMLMVQPSTLQPGQRGHAEARYTITAEDAARGYVYNTAIARGTPPSGPDVTDEDDVTTPLPTTVRPGVVPERPVPAVTRQQRDPVIPLARTGGDRLLLTLLLAAMAMGLGTLLVRRSGRLRPVAPPRTWR
jgi:uncharacterized repeat protein (TIGR01451 family)